MGFRRRQERLLVKELGRELVIYDQAADRVHRLNKTAAFIWRQCDGAHSVDDMVTALKDHSGAAEMIDYQSFIRVRRPGEKRVSRSNH